MNLLAFVIMIMAFSLSGCEARTLDTAVPIKDSKSDDEMALDAYCLKSSYPEIKDIEITNAGDLSIIFRNGYTVSYKEKDSQSLAASVEKSLADIYPLEPNRPETPEGFAPGRKRSYELLGALYGTTREEAAKNIVPVKFQGKTVQMSRQAAAALKHVEENIEKNNFNHSELLRPEGGFAWRKIAGEKVRSAHSYGIAIDLSAKKAPYWRWSNKMPHPMQKTYPAEIVEAFENEGFIWGGKWHEYDLMHFEYRPELICKAKALRARYKLPIGDLNSHSAKLNPENSDLHTATPRP